MVMGTPSSQCVGLEFVRQYYTVLSKAPVHLHRFYSHNSSFTYGGANGKNEPTVGQADIHKKILSLNFVDCHAKIRMVDAHWTLDNGVVIQVLGELSISKKPMRRFMQTFVLAPQSPKKYFVLNDIFRYQDEVFVDDERAEDGISEPEEDGEPTPISDSVYPTNSATINGSNHLPEQESPTAHIPVQPTPPTAHVPSSPPQPPPQSPPPSVVSNVVPTAHVPPTALTDTQTSVLHQEPRPTTPPSAVEEEGWDSPGPSTEGPESIEEHGNSAAIPVDSPPQPDSVSSFVAQQPPPPSNEPKTYANLLKNNTQNFSHTGSTPSQTGSASVHSTSSLHFDQANSPPSMPPQQLRSETSLNRSTGPNSNPSLNLQSQPPSSSSSSGFTPRGGGMRGFPSSDDDKRRSIVPDTQQVFVGNLPHTIGEDKLRNEFAKFGKIVDIRINTAKGKTGTAGPGRQVPNFGFISFDDEASVERCLSARPIYLNGESRLNVEEKKARSRGDSSSSMMGGRPPNSGRGGSSMQGGMRGPPQGGRGGGRGGFNRDGRGGGGISRGGFMQRR